MKIIRILIAVLLFASFTVSNAEAQTTITANGQLCEEGGGCYPFTLTFNPKGGAVTGVFKAASGEYSILANFSGTFAGGDGGAVSGKVTGQGTTTGKGITSLNGTWSGVFRANGKGDGKWEWTADSATGGTWSVTYPANAFQSATAVPTITLTPTPGLWDLSVQKVVALQAVEGGKFVLGKRAAVRVFLAWPDPTTTVDVKVELLVNGAAVESKTQKVKSSYNAAEIASLKNSVNFIVPASRLKGGQNVFTARASLIAPAKTPQMQDTNLGNNLKTVAYDTYTMKSISVLIVSTNKNVGITEVNTFLAEAKPYINSVYPLSVNIPPYFYRSEHLYFDTAMHNVIALEAARQLYNSQVAKTGTRARFAVGLYPQGYYGADVHGMSYWWNRQAVLVEVTSPESMPHEIGHNWFADEYSSTSPGKFLPPVNVYRADSGSLEDLGAKAARNYINFMGNAGVNPAWVDVNTWDKLVNVFKIGIGYRPANGLAQLVPQTDDQTVDGFFIKGVIGKNDSIQVSPPMWLQNLSLYPNVGESDYEFSIADQKGIETARVPVYVDLKQNDPAPFIAVLPASRDAATIFLRRSGKLLDKWTRSANPPQVKLDAPIKSGNNVTLTWQASDADKDALTYTVLFSYNGGETWLTAATDLKEPRLTLDATNMPGCDRCLVRVLTSDGWNTTSADLSSPFAVENKPPSISIASPKDGATLSLDMPLVFSAAAVDMEDGLLDEASVVWRSDKDGELGQGSLLMISSLSNGAHTITVTAKDKAGAQAQHSLKITINADETTVTPPLTATPASKAAPTLAATPDRTPTPDTDLTSAITNSLIAGGVVLLCGFGLFGVGAVFWMMRRS